MYVDEEVIVGVVEGVPAVITEKEIRHSSRPF
jgi:hypothetical protein